MMNIMNNIFVQLSESDKRIIFGVLIAFILVFVLIGYLGMLVIKIIKWQGKKMDSQVADVLTTYVITERKNFMPYAKKKNIRIFFKQAWIPLLMIIFAVALLLIYDAINKDFSYNPFNVEKGFGSLIFTWDFKNNQYYTKVFGLKLLAEWPAVVNKPHLVKEAWVGYIFVPFIVIGGIWYLLSVQGFIARAIRIEQIARKNLGANLDDFNQGKALAGITNNQNPTVNNNNQNI